MPVLPTEIAAVLAPFAGLFSQPTWIYAQQLLCGAILACGPRTICAILRTLGLGQCRQFQKYHRVLNQAQWSNWQAARLLFTQLVDAFVPMGPLVLGIDEHLERRWPPFAPAYVRYTQKLAAYADTLSRVMTITDVAEVTGLSWDTVKGIVKKRLQKDYGTIPLKDLKYLSIDEIYVGRRKQFYTLVLDLESGRIVWVSRGRGKAALQGFWRRLRKAKAKIAAVAMDMSEAYWAAVLRPCPRPRWSLTAFTLSSS